MAHVQNTGFHRSLTVAAARAPVMRGAGSLTMISDKLRHRDTAAASGSTTTVHIACAGAGNALSTTLRMTDNTADKGM